MESNSWLWNNTGAIAIDFFPFSSVAKRNVIAFGTKKGDDDRRRLSVLGKSLLQIQTYTG
jgi:hypothetical protein